MDLQAGAGRDDIEVELVDLRDFKLPLFDEKASNMLYGGMANLQASEVG